MKHLSHSPVCEELQRNSVQYLNSSFSSHSQLTLDNILIPTSGLSFVKWVWKYLLHGVAGMVKWDNACNDYRYFSKWWPSWCWLLKKIGMTMQGVPDAPKQRLGMKEKALKSDAGLKFSLHCSQPCARGPNLSSSFLICKIRLIMVPTSRLVMKRKWW